MYKLGKRAPRFDERTFEFAAYVPVTLPRLKSAAKEYLQIDRRAWTMMANDEFGDCTCAAAGHMIQEWKMAASKQSVVLSDKAILKAYKAVNGKVDLVKKKDPDAGCAMLDVLNYWRQIGIGGHKIRAFAAIDLKNSDHAKYAISLFGACYIGVALPAFTTPKRGPDWNTIPWTVPRTGAKGKRNRPDEENGHCIPAVGYDSRYAYVVTWGGLKKMSWKFYEAYADEAYAVLSSDYLKAGKSPGGFDFAALNRDLAAL